MIEEVNVSCLQKLRIFEQLQIVIVKDSLFELYLLRVSILSRWVANGAAGDERLDAWGSISVSIGFIGFLEIVICRIGNIMIILIIFTGKDAAT